MDAEETTPEPEQVQPEDQHEELLLAMSQALDSNQTATCMSVNFVHAAYPISVIFT